MEGRGSGETCRKNVALAGHRVLPGPPSAQVLSARARAASSHGLSRAGGAAVTLLPPAEDDEAEQGNGNSGKDGRAEGRAKEGAGGTTPQKAAGIQLSPKLKGVLRPSERLQKDLAKKPSQAVPLPSTWEPSAQRHT